MCGQRPALLSSSLVSGQRSCVIAVGCGFKNVVRTDVVLIVERKGSTLPDTSVRQPERWRNPAARFRIRCVMNRASLDLILQLPTAERVEIAQEIWESVVEYPESVVLTNAQKQELERRWQAFEQNPSEGEPWAEVKRSLLSE
jgi:putative addiction module component (TIGR02574 family)